MGIDAHALNFLRFAHQFGPFGPTLTIGRQNIDIRPRHFRRLTGIDLSSSEATYCDALLVDYFGAASVDSIDNSAFENATIIHDMNLPLPDAIGSRKFDTIIDGGCLEHVYNVPQAFRNLSLLGKAGTQILHILPANNFCGHGFYQFSPELFFSLYRQANGYRDTRVFLADLTELQTWFQVSPPPPGSRVNVHTGAPVYALVRTVLDGETFQQENIQQSDYVYRWAQAETQPESHKKKRSAGAELARSLRTAALSHPLLAKLAAALRSRKHAATTERLDSRNPHLTPLSISSLLE